MNDLITALTLAAALAATFGVAYCFAWVCLRTLMALMPARKEADVASPARTAARLAIFRKWALGQKH